MAAASSGAPLRVWCLGSLGSDGTITGVTTGIGGPVNMASYQNLTFYVQSSAALSAGTLILEEADFDPDLTQIYSGTWSAIATITLSTPFSGAGGMYAYHVGGPGGSYAFGFVRARIGTTVVGGLLSVTLRAN